MIWLVALVLFGILSDRVFWWIETSIIKKQEDKFPFTGSEAAYKIIKKQNWKTKVEKNKESKYFTEDNIIELEEYAYRKKTAYAIAVVCHELAHVEQRMNEYPPMMFLMKHYKQRSILNKVIFPLFVIVSILTGNHILNWIIVAFYVSLLLLHYATVVRVETDTFHRAVTHLESLHKETPKFPSKEKKLVKKHLKSFYLNYWFNAFYYFIWH